MFEVWQLSSSVEVDRPPNDFKSNCFKGTVLLGLYRGLPHI